MTRDEDRSESLEVIDLDSEVETPTRTSRPLSRSGLTVGAVVMAGIVALLVGFVVVTHDHTRRQADTSAAHTPTTVSPISAASNTLAPTPTWLPVQLPRGPILGRYYPAFDHTDTTRFVLPSGRTLTLSGDLTNLIGGLGATFDGSITTHTQPCCSHSLVKPFDSVNFQIFHAAPSDLFATHTTGAVSTPLVDSPRRPRSGSTASAAANTDTGSSRTATGP